MRWRSGFIREQGKWDDGFIVIRDVGAVYSSGEIAELRKIAVGAGEPQLVR
jgi:hypothetical protein